MCIYISIQPYIKEKVYMYIYLCIYNYDFIIKKLMKLLKQ